MNKIHNVIWSKAQNAWIVVAEGSKACSKAGAGALKVMIALIMLSPTAGMAATLPQGGAITVGQGTITTNGSNQMVIKQNTDKLGINWQSFNVGADGHVIFDQPGTHSIALNRVIGSDGSSILGKIDANGQVFLINPNGVIFGKDSKVNVGGLVASTLNITDADFTNGNYKFSAGVKNGEIQNLGSLQASEGGYIALIGKSVKNQGLIQAKLGTAALASGDAVTLDFSGDGLINIQVDKSTINALVDNKGLIKADGGNVLMTARSTNALTQTVVNNDGVIQAQTIGSRNGKIFLDGGFDDGAVRVAGTLDASAPVSGNGGFIETSGASVKVANTANVTTKANSGKTGTWLIDPEDFSIWYGDDPQTQYSIGSTTLENNLASTNVEIQTSGATAGKGNIIVGSSITWDADTTLTLTAHNNINFQDSINVNGANGGLILNYGNHGSDSSSHLNFMYGSKVNLNGANSSYGENGNAFTVIRSVGDLALLSDSASGTNFALGGDIDASDTATWNGGLGYKPAGTSTTFTGTLSGLGHKIENLTIKRPTEDSIGLIGVSNGAKIQNITVNGTVDGKSKTGLVVGAGTNTALYDVNTSGTVKGGDNTGGVVGELSSGRIESVMSTASVTGGWRVGGILGSLIGTGVSTISQSSWNGVINSQSSGGGLVGGSDNANAAFYEVYTGGFVNSANSAGGLIGTMTGGVIDKAFSTATVDSSGSAGGFVDSMYGGAIIRNAYSSGNVSGDSNVGGFVARLNQSTVEKSFTTSSATVKSEVSNQPVGGFVGTTWGGTISNSYSTGQVTGGTLAGGFSGESYNTIFQYDYTTSSITSNGIKGGFVASRNLGSVTSSFWDTGKSGIFSSIGGVGKTSSQMKSASTYVGWNLSTAGNSGQIWRSYDGFAAPMLTGFMSTAYVTDDLNLSTTYTGSKITKNDVMGGNLGSPSITQTNNFFIDWANAKILGDTSGKVDIVNAGTYILDPFYSTQLGYDIVQTGTTQLTVDKAQLYFNATGADKVYDGDNWADLDITWVSDNGVFLGIDASFTDKNAGSNKAITVDGITLFGPNADNYFVNIPSGPYFATISKASLNVTAEGVNKVYDGSKNASVTLKDDRVSGDSLVISSSNLFSDKNAGSGKIVSVNGINVTGSDASNYTWNLSTTTIADVSKASLNVTAAGLSKVYDGSTLAEVTFADNRIGSDVISISSDAAAYGDKNSGVGKSITVEGINVTGIDSQNYTWNSTAATTADISKASLHVSASGQNKVYDGSTAAGISLSDNRIGGDDLSISAGSSVFNDKNAGAGKAINVGGIVVTGADAQNYSWNTTASTTADISKANLNVSAVGHDKTYDGSTTAGVTLSDNRIGSDDLSISSSGASFADKNAGTGKTVSVGGITVTGADAQNYTWNSVASTTANIFKALLNISATAQNKSYDGSTAANVTLSDNRVTGDDITASAGSSAFADKNAGSAKNVTVNGINLSGADAANYTFNTTASTTADVSKASLTVKANSSGKVEGTADGALSWSLQNGSLYGSDTVNGNLVRDAGETHGIYGINKGTLSAGSNYDLTVVPGSFEITKAPTVPVDPTPPVVVPPVVVPPVVVPPVVVNPKPPVVTEETKALEDTKQIISTITVATKQTSTSTAAEPSKASQSGTSAVIGDYRLLNLGMKLPDEIFAEDSSKK